MVNDELGIRMKENYEERNRTYLTRRTPVAIRIDGKAFHTFTKGFDKPFDKILGDAMAKTMKYLCENIQGCVLGYTQSDEITLILIDYKKLTSDAWFDYQVQKMCSVAASMATMAFNKYFKENVDELYDEYFQYSYNNSCDEIYSLDIYMKEKCQAYYKAIDKGAMFDARCFNIPKEEVCNLIYWRQLDATRNSIQMVAQANFTHKELQGLNCNKLQDKLLTEKNINWNTLKTKWKRGTACIYDIENNQWKIDYEMPILKGEDRKYIDDLIFIEE